jgi:hypothetical protein
MCVCYIRSPLEGGIPRRWPLIPLSPIVLFLVADSLLYILITAREATARGEATIEEPIVAADRDASVAFVSHEEDGILLFASRTKEP